MMLSGFGRYPRHEVQLAAPRDLAGLRGAIGQGSTIARGNGRAYGDSAIAPATIDMRQFDRMLAFEETTGQLVAEAGVMLADVIDTFLPLGWFPYVTPGTKFVTLGGMAAADVHGKNHHRDGGFGNFVDWLDLLGADGAIRRCSLAENPELFAWTLGGMGLTGAILRLALRLRKVETAWIRQTTHPEPDLESTFKRFEASEDATYSVAWIDALAKGRGLGRSLVMLGEHATADELPAARRGAPLAAAARRQLSVPLDAPGWLLNGFSVRLFNRLYYRSGQAHRGERLCDLDSFFYPLDAVLGWNRIYGRRGLVQFQCVLPLESSLAGMRQLLEAISRAGKGSFLAVLKRLGPEERKISFPMSGYTLALDFPVGAAVLALLYRLEGIAADHGGRCYLAKDAHMSQDLLHRSDPRAARFAEMRQARGHAAHFASFQSMRLGL